MLISVIVMVIGFVGGIMLILGRRDMKKNAAVRAHKVAYKDHYLDVIFDGRRVVTFEVQHDTLPADVLIEGGGARGYNLTSRTQRERALTGEELVFTLQTQQQPPVAPGPAPTSSG